MAPKSPTLASRVTAAREAAGFKTASAAVEASKKTKWPVSAGSWSEVESGKNDNPRLTTLLGMAATLRCKPSQLLEAAAAHAVRELPLAAIFTNPLNVRKTPATEEEIDALAANIKAVGLLQPITVRPLPPTENVKGECFEIVFGENRYRAVGRAFGSKATITAQVREISDAELALMMLAENLQRIDMAPLDVATALAKAKRPNKELAAQLGKSVRWVQEMVSVGNHLCDDARNYLADGHLRISHAILLASIHDQGEQATLAAEACKQTEDQLRNAIAKLKESKAAPKLPIEEPAPPRPRPPSQEPVSPPAPPPPSEATPPSTPAEGTGTRTAPSSPPPAAAPSITRPVTRSLAWDTTGALKDGSFHAVIFGPAGGPAKKVFQAPSWNMLCAEIETLLPNSDFIHSPAGWTRNALDEPVFGGFGDVTIIRTDGLDG